MLNDFLEKQLHTRSFESGRDERSQEAREVACETMEALGFGPLRTEPSQRMGIVRSAKTPPLELEGGAKVFLEQQANHDESGIEEYRLMVVLDEEAEADATYATVSKYDGMISINDDTPEDEDSIKANELEVVYLLRRIREQVAKAESPSPVIE